VTRHARLVRRLSALPRSTPRKVAGALVLGAAATGFAVFVLPELGGAGAEWRRVRGGDLPWLAVAAVAEIFSYAGYVALLRAVFGRRLRWRDSFLVTMAGVAATRLLATAGAGGIALTSWALLRLGFPARAVARGVVGFLVMLYSVYMAALLVVGLGLATGALPGPRDAALTLVPAALAAGAIALALLAARSPGAIERRVGALTGRRRLAQLLANAGDGIRFALMLARRRPSTLLGALAWWGFDIGALAAAYHVFGSAPQLPVLVMGYFVGMLGNVLPVPGGVGGVEGGMIGAFAALGEPAGTALAAVLAYRLVAFWLPTLIGAPAYVALRRSRAPRPDATEGP
jgi:uncharacterized protein (TIRG00374 family)